MIAARTDDGRFGSFRFTAGFRPGAWRPELPVFASDPFAWVAYVKPFLIESPSQFRSDGPNALTSDAVRRGVRRGEGGRRRNSSTRTADQTEQALYWADRPPGAGSSGPSRRSRGCRSRRTRACTRCRSSRPRTPIINCWNDKAYWSFWRPITAIRLADTDGNPATDADPAWEPLLATPPFPDHPSGHACASGAIVATLQDFFGTDKIAFTASAPPAQDAERTPASRERSRRSSTRASGPGSTSERRTSRPPDSRKRSRSGGSITTSRRLTDELTAGPRGGTSRGPPPSRNWERDVADLVGRAAASQSAKYTSRGEPADARPSFSIHCATASYAERICGYSTWAFVIRAYASRCAGSTRSTAPPSRRLRRPARRPRPGRRCPR